jgi:hypothetical protein
MNVRDSRVSNYPPRWNGAPSQELLVIRRNHQTGQVSLDPLRWGLIPCWCKDATGGRKPINAKAETVARLPTFREAYRKRRCILPVDGFFEWKAIKGQRAKQPYAIAMKDGSPFGIAGSRAMYWNEFRGGGIAAIGWDQVGDLKSLRDPNAIKARMDEVYPEPESVVNANQCFDFAHRMRPGDWIYAKKGRREIVGFGVIKSEYRFDPDREYFQNVRGVDWQKSGSWPLAEGRMLSMKTVTEITDDTTLVEELEQLVGLTERIEPLQQATAYSVRDFSGETAIPEETIRLWENRLKRKRHVVFQGPPGTGKTFVAELLARLLIGNTFGFSETIQFHPSYSYEDFMQGIRPVIVENQLTFKRVDGRYHTARDAGCTLRQHGGQRLKLSAWLGWLTLPAASVAVTV